MTRSAKNLGGAGLVAAALALTGCGGHDYINEPAATAAVPASASQSSGGFIDYLMKLIASSADSLDPVDVSTLTAPVDETGEPTPLP